MTGSTSPTAANPLSYKWATTGDIDAFFARMLVNVVNLADLACILVFAFGFPARRVYTQAFPGTAPGVMYGIIVHTIMASRLAQHTDVTAMPLGLVAPPTISMARTALGRAFVAAKATTPALGWR